MAEAILDALEPVLTRWTMGGQAGSLAPAPWRAALSAEAQEAEMQLLALSGHFLGTLILPDPVGEVRTLTDLPRLARPTLPDALRPRARRLLQQVREQTQRRYLLDLLESRGCTLHPGDWLPGVNEDVPDIYAPWQDWIAASDMTATSEAALDADTWSMLPTAARRVAFAALRRQDPARASALLAEKIGAESADVRVRLLELIAIGLSDADQPLLEGLANDRAPRVKALAAALRARLGHAGEAGEDAAELADFFTVQTKGLLRRTRFIVPQAIKTPAQRNRRTALLDTLSLADFALALDQSPEDLIALWPWTIDPMLDRSLAEMAARSASDTIVALTAKAINIDGEVNPLSLSPLLPRLSREQRRAIARNMLRSKNASFTRALDIIGGDGGVDDAILSLAGATLLHHHLSQENGSAALSAELFALGLITSQQGAQQALEKLAEAGLIASDPRLDMLRLNAALDLRGAVP